jgi:hypothetical protein
MEVKRMTGGNMLNMPLTAMKAFRRVKGMIPHLAHLGGASSGGAPSGGRSRVSKMC